MNNITLKEYLSSNDLFSAINSAKFFEFINSNSNLSLQLQYGQRLVPEPFSELDVNVLASLIVERFGDKWVKLIAINVGDLRLDSSDSIIKDVESNSVDDRNQNTTNTNKVTSYNDTALITDNGSDNTMTIDSSKDVTTKETTHNISLISLYENLNLSDKTNILNTVNTDIVNLITLNIY